MWLRAAGVDDVEVERGPRFNQASLVIESAILGRGVALAKSTLAAADIEAGRLVRPIEGMRLAQVPGPIAAGAVKTGKLVRVLERFAPMTSGVFLYHSGHRQMMPKLRAFIEHVKNYRAGDPMTACDDDG